MDVLAKMAESGIVPVVVLEKVEDAVPTAKAMLKGGVCVMEITFRTAAAADCIRAVAKEVPDMIVGAGTVVNLRKQHPRNPRLCHSDRDYDGPEAWHQSR